MYHYNRSNQILGIFGLLALAASGCAVNPSSGPESPESQASSSEQQSQTASSAEGTGSETEAASKTQNQKATAQLVHNVKDVGLEAPESILFDAEADIYYVSNVHGDPLATDGNGFISKVGPDGKVLELKWIDGSKPGVTLNAPKGMAVSGGFLYVSDITWIRVFDRKTGEPKGKIFAKGATFLNGLATTPEGEIVFSDTGWKSAKEGFAATGSDALFVIDPKTVAAKEMARSKDLGNPNGVASTKAGLWVVNDEGELYMLGKDGKKEKTTKLAKGGLDGVVALDDGRFLVSSWEGNAIYIGKPGGEFKVLVSDLKSPASIGYDSKRGRVLIPQMTENQALVYELPKDPDVKPAKAPAKKEAAKKDPASKATSNDKQKAQPQTKKAEPAADTKKGATPASKAEPAKSGGPAKPAQPAKPAEPAKKPAPAKKPVPASTGGAKKAEPATPAKPAEPAKKDTSAKKAEPATPAKPAEPANKGTIAQPAKPAEPAKK